MRKGLLALWVLTIINSAVLLIYTIFIIATMFMPSSDADLRKWVEEDNKTTRDWVQDNIDRHSGWVSSEVQRMIDYGNKNW
ncbi:MAG: hypothetical protein V1719_02765 [Patescibacteria group bacterium]